MINVYVSHPYSGNPEENIRKAKQVVDRIAKESVDTMKELDVVVDEMGLPQGSLYDVNDIYVPICPLLTFPDSMSETSGVIRRHAMAFCLSLVDACDELWVCSGVLTPGMREEITRASEKGKPVRWYF